MATPYMLIVVGMGYTRQAAAIGLVLLGLVAFGREQFLKSILLISLAASFHKTAILVLPFLALATRRNKLSTLVFALLAASVLYAALLAEYMEGLWRSYAEEQMHSEGGQIRLLMNAIPGAFMILFHRRLPSEPNERKLFLWFSVVSLASLPLTSFASTAVDRVALYFMPLQSFVFSRFARLFKDVTMRSASVVSILIYYGAVLYVWLNYAVHAEYWLPYQIRFNG